MHQARHVPLIQEQIGSAGFRAQETIAIFVADNETFDQVELTLDQLGDAKNFLLENMEVTIMFFQGIVIGIDLPVAVELRVVETDPGIRGDTATGGNKPATLETGYVVKVPLFIETDDVLRIDTRTGQYIERA